MNTEYDDVDEAQDAVQKMRDRIRSAIKGECIIAYDAFEYDDNGIPIDNLDEIAVMGKTRSEDECNETYVGNVIENPTWFQLAIEANNMATAADDRHHIFFEDVEIMRETDDGIKVLSLFLGS